MNIKNIARRRGVTIAAAALSVAMVSPFVHAVTPGTPFVSVANAQQDQASTPPASGSDKAIYSPGNATQKGTISGSAVQIVQSDIGFGTVQSTGNPVQGVRVYAQWYEGENTQHSSPVYYTETDAQGNFTINMAPYTDANGVIRTFRADASVGLLGDGEKSRDQLREKIRVWTELPADKTDKYRLVHQPVLVRLVSRELRPHADLLAKLITALLTVAKKTHGCICTERADHTVRIGVRRHVDGEVTLSISLGVVHRGRVLGVFALVPLGVHPDTLHRVSSGLDRPETNVRLNNLHGGPGDGALLGRVSRGVDGFVATARGGGACLVLLRVSNRDERCPGCYGVDERAHHGNRKSRGRDGYATAAGNILDVHVFLPKK